jgi:hypothetical protein
MPKQTHIDEATLANELDLVELREGVTDMFAMMRQQRDALREKPGPGKLGSAHSPETRRVMAELLDWYLIEYETKIKDFLSN